MEKIKRPVRVELRRMVDQAVHGHKRKLRRTPPASALVRQVQIRAHACVSRFEL